MLLRNSLLFSIAVLGVAAYPLMTGRDLIGEFRAAPAPQKPVFQNIATTSPSSTARVVRLQADDRGHYSGDFIINGRKVRAMVDTGASTIALNRSTARRLGLTLSTTQFSQRVTTANGEILAAPVVLERVAIGKIEVRNVAAFVLDDAALAGTLIGMSFLKATSISVADNTLYLKQ